MILRARYARSSTDLGYAATRHSRSPSLPALAPVLFVPFSLRLSPYAPATHVRYSHRVWIPAPVSLRARYGMSGTNV
eukprot:2216834-Rhodomonas_salina.1